MRWAIAITVSHERRDREGLTGTEQQRRGRSFSGRDPFSWPDLPQNIREKQSLISISPRSGLRSVVPLTGPLVCTRSSFSLSLAHIPTSINWRDGIVFVFSSDDVARTGCWGRSWSMASSTCTCQCYGALSSCELFIAMQLLSDRLRRRGV